MTLSLGEQVVKDRHPVSDGDLDVRIRSTHFTTNRRSSMPILVSRARTWLSENQILFVENTRNEVPEPPPDVKL